MMVNPLLLLGHEIQLSAQLLSLAPVKFVNVSCHASMFLSTWRALVTQSVPRPSRGIAIIVTHLRIAAMARATEDLQVTVTVPIPLPLPGTKKVDMTYGHNL